MSVNSHTSSQSLKRREVEKRREQIYQLHLKGWTQVEIAESLQVDQSTVSRAIAEVRDGNACITQSSRDMHSKLLQEIHDRITLVMREAWRMYHDSNNAGKPELRSSLLARIVSSLAVLSRFLPDLEQLWMTDQLEDVLKRQAMIEKDWAERRLKERTIHPITSSS
ncbi:MAG TPA: helix-turn-helix domain-containing protein [Candidatus Bathyarchaeia archaeon]|nr:helix-turn-helix domain-containing protein [Candidatus Bathyarchaeia archaeon]